MDRLDSIPSDYPKPIARAYARARNAMEGFEAVRGFVDVFEITVQYLALAVIARYTAGESRTDAIDAALVRALREPSAGTWVRMLRDLQTTLAPTLREMAGCDLRERRDDFPSFDELARTFSLAPRLPRYSVLDVCEGLVHLRNAMSHQRIPASDLVRHLDRLRCVVEELLVAMPEVGRRELVAAAQVQHVRKGWEVIYFIFRGEGLPKRFDTSLPRDHVPAPVRGALYLRDRATGGLVEVSPFMVAVGDDIVWFNSLDRAGRPRYVCPYAWLDPKGLDEACRELQERVPGLFDAASSPTAALAPLVRAAAADGVITRAEFDVLVQEARKLGVASDNDAARSLVEQAIEEHGSGARLEYLSAPATMPLTESILHWWRAGRRSSGVAALAVPSESSKPLPGAEALAPAPVSSERAALPITPSGSRSGAAPPPTSKQIPTSKEQTAKPDSVGPAPSAADPAAEALPTRGEPALADVPLHDVPAEAARLPGVIAEGRKALDSLRRQLVNSLPRVMLGADARTPTAVVVGNDGAGDSAPRALPEGEHQLAPRSPGAPTEGGAGP